MLQAKQMSDVNLHGGSMTAHCVKEVESLEATLHLMRSVHTSPK